MVALKSWIEAEKSTEAVPFSRPGARPPSAKNRVGNFFSASPDCAGQTTTQVVEGDWELTFFLYDSPRSASLSQSEEVIGSVEYYEKQRLEAAKIKMDEIAEQYRDADLASGEDTYLAPNVRVWYQERTFTIAPSPKGLKGVWDLISKGSDVLTIEDFSRRIQNDSGWIDKGIGRIYYARIREGSIVDLDFSSRFMTSGSLAIVDAGNLTNVIVQSRFIVTTTRYKYQP